MIRLSIRRPVAVAMTYSAVALLGLFSWQNIPIEFLPDTELPRLTVNASWRGSSPETVEAFLTSPLEAAIQQVQGVDSIMSDSSEGQASISVVFDRDVDMDFVRLELSERLSSLDEDLPPGVQNVVVQPYVPREFQDQRRPFLSYSFTGPYLLEALHRHLEEVVAPELSQIDGVAVTRVFGGRERRIEIRVDEEEIRSLGLNPFSVYQRIQELDMVQEAGVIRDDAGERTVTIVNRPQSADDIRRAPLRAIGGTVVTVGDVASVHDTFGEPTRLERIDGRPSVTMSLTKERGSNTVRTADEVKARLAELEALSPYGSEFILEYDESEEVRRQLTDLRVRAGVAAVVIFAVLLLFLGSFRSAGLVFATIAFSVLISLNLIYFGGLTLNLLTLMGLAMGFGLIVDNSIVVLENIYRRWQRGESPSEASEVGAREVVLPILASTATTLIVFVPFVYLQGELRVFYVPLAIVVALTLLASLFVAFSFIPSISARILRGPRPTFHLPGVGGGAGAGAAGVAAAPRRAPLYQRFYSTLIGFTLLHPWVAIFVTLSALAGSGYLFDKYVTTGVVWGGGGSQRTYISIAISLPRGSNLERTNGLVEFFEEKLRVLPEVEQYTASIQESSARMEVTFPDSLELTAIPPAIKEQMLAYSHTFTGAEVRVTGYGPSFYGGGGSPPQYTIKVLGYNFETVRDIAEDIGGRLERLARVQEVDTNASGRFTRDKAAEFTLRVDRARLARFDMGVGDLVNQIGRVVAGTGGVQSIKVGGEELQYEVKVKDVDYIDVLALRESTIQAPDGRDVRLGDVVSIERRDVLSTIHRENQQYERTVAYEFRGPQKLGDLYRDALIENMTLPAGYSIEVSSGFRFGLDQQNQIYALLAISILLVYMVTAALFESIRQPLAVLLTVPMALIGVFLIFFYARATFTREAYIGVIMMGGIVVNNAILLVDHINNVRRSTDLALYDAILRGTLERVRPILMTTATTVLGLLPLVLFSETADANIWNALGYALIGGLLSSTLFVLTTTPALYYLFEKGPAERAAWAARGPVAPEDRGGAAGGATGLPGVAPQPG
ncbi:efflux RND transporter permease subunit [Gaopeijia maritima]|uniref:efflux RND transporter permease subunit n=1 Tax=Gaopeijia maritima TaxID=3119007 RepID=UPI00324C8B1B